MSPRNCVNQEQRSAKAGRISGRTAIVTGGAMGMGGATAWEPVNRSTDFDD